MDNGFGIDQNTKSSNSVNYDKGGFKKAVLTEVKVEEVGKETKYKVLSFTFLDHEGIKTFKHSEFALESTDPDYSKKINGMNTRIKHIYEAYQPLTVAMGAGATTFEDYFNKIAVAFNTGNVTVPNAPIYKNDKGGTILVWIKVAFYSKKGNIGFPLSPNFVERIKDAANSLEPKSLTIDNRYDNLEQPKKAAAAGPAMGGGIHVGNSDANDF